MRCIYDGRQSREHATNLISLNINKMVIILAGLMVYV